MNRILLALLALLGCIAQLSPAQARGGAAVDMEIGVSAPVAAGQRQTASHIAAAASRQPRDWDGDAGMRTIAVRPAVLVPTVRQGIDRARE